MRSCKFCGNDIKLYIEYPDPDNEEVIIGVHCCSTKCCWKNLVNVDSEKFKLFLPKSITLI